MGTEHGSDTAGYQDDGADCRREYDWGETLPSTAVVEVVADATQCKALDLSPLYGTVDPDSLDALLAGPRSSGFETTVSFTYAGCELVLEGDGTVRASPLG